MNCPKCGGTSSRILDTIRVREGLRRHRVCNGKRCRHKFATLERVEQWDVTTRSYVAAGQDGLQLVPSQPVALPLQQEEPAAKTKRYVASADEDCLVNVCAEAQPLLVEWWNVSRKSKHGAKATWTQSAWEASVHRVAKLPAWQQVLLAKAGVENGWQSLKPDYVKDELSKPTALGRPMPKDPAMLAALEQWPSQTA
jgi:hypothetical protein